MNVYLILLVQSPELKIESSTFGGMLLLILFQKSRIIIPGYFYRCNNQNGKQSLFAFLTRDT